MAKTAYPTSADLQSYLTTAGFATATVTALDLATAVSAAKLDLERAVSRQFLAASADETRYYDPPTNGDTLAIDELCAVTSVQYQPEGGTAEPLVANTDYWLLEPNAVTRGLPYERLRLRRTWRSPLTPSLYRSIRITGRFGWGTQTSIAGANVGMPEDAWLAILARASWKLWASLRQKTTGGVLGWSEGDVKKEFGVETYSGLRDLWAADYQAAVDQYFRYDA